jgi:nucleoside-diphosphate-sugar epimerase
MRVLVAGDRGYIGHVLGPLLRAAGHQVDGLDLDRYDGCDLGPMPDGTPPPPADIRTVTAARLSGYDAVVCLAALSNHPLGSLYGAAGSAAVTEEAGPELRIRELLSAGPVDDMLYRQPAYGG